ALLPSMKGARRKYASSRRWSAVEIAQVWCRLAFLGRHQEAVGADHVVFPADQHMRIVFGAIDEIPEWVRLAPIDATDRPGTGERAVGDRRLDAQQARVGFIESHPLADDRGIVFMQGHPTALVGAGALEAAGLDLEQVVATVAI